MRRKRDVLETVARTAPPRTRLAGWLLQMPKLRPGLALYFALGGVAWPGVPAAAVVAGAFAMALCLLDYNLYRGRREDAVNWKAAHRPLAGVEQRIPSAEVLIAITGGFAMLAPLVVGRFGPALLYLTLIVGYVLAYEARYARRPSALVKTGSAVAVTIGVVLGVASAVAPPPWSLVVAGSGLVAWRACAEMSWDVLDEPADRANGIVTPVTKWGARRVLTFNGVATIAVVGASAVIACAHANLVVGTFIGAAAAAIIGGYAQTVRALTPGPDAARVAKVQRYLAEVVLTWATASALAILGGPLYWSVFGVELAYAAYEWPRRWRIEFSPARPPAA